MRAVLAGCVLLTACAADIPENVFPCSDGCPPGFVCRADGYCWRTPDGRDAGPAVDAGPGVDGGPARDGGPGLDDGGPDAAGACVAGDCTDPALSRCDAISGTCMPCRDSSECADPDLGVCDDGSVCVQCTAADPTACGANPCTSANTCSAYGLGRRVCEPCDTDANCGMDLFCVPLSYMGTPRGGYCLSETCAQPFSTALGGRTTLSGRTGGTYCGINESLATCEAVLAYSDTCDKTMPCPESGLCRPIDGVNVCTYPCNVTGECSGRCDSTDPPAFCSS